MAQRKGNGIHLLFISIIRLVCGCGGGGSIINKGEFISRKKNTN